MSTYGYTCASDEDRARQVEQLKAAGANIVFSDKIRGSKTFRPNLIKLIMLLQRGDLVLVHELARFAQNVRELLELIARITERGAHFKSLGDPLFDTTTSTAYLLCPLLAALTKFETQLVRQRTRAGRIRAAARGTKFGRKPKLTKRQCEEVFARLARGDTHMEIARLFRVDRSMISRLAKVGHPGRTKVGE